MVVFSNPSSSNSHSGSSPSTTHGAGHTNPLGRDRDGWTRIMERAMALKIARDALVAEVMHAQCGNSGGGGAGGTGEVGLSAGEGKNKIPVYRPRMDLYDDPNSPTISAALELPGLKRDSIKVVVQDQFLLVSGERKPFRRQITPSHPSTSTHRDTQQRTSPPKEESAEGDADGMIIDEPVTHSTPRFSPRSTTPPSARRRPATPYDPIADARALSQSQSQSRSGYRSLARGASTHSESEPQSRFMTSSERDRERSASPLTGAASHSQSQGVPMETHNQSVQSPTTPTATSFAPIPPAARRGSDSDTHGSAPSSRTALPILSSASKAAKHIVREFKFGRFQRVVALGPGVEASDISATLDDGILTITWPRPPASVLANMREAEIKVELHADAGRTTPPFPGSASGMHSRRGSGPDF